MLIWLEFEWEGCVPCKQGMQHPAAPHAGGVATCAPAARGSPLRDFPGDVLRSHARPCQRGPKFCLPLAGCSPKAREPVPELAAACRSCGTASHGTVPPGQRSGGETQPFCGKTSRPGAGMEPFMVTPCRDMPSTWQHGSARMAKFRGMLVALGCPHQMLFIHLRAGPPRLPSREAWWWAAFHRVRFWVAGDSLAKRCWL